MYYLFIIFIAGTGVGKILGNEESNTHYIDGMIFMRLFVALERFQKDYAVYDRFRREEEKSKRQQDLEKKRIEQLER